MKRARSINPSIDQDIKVEGYEMSNALTSGSVSCLVSPESFPIPAASSRASSLAWVSASTGWMESPSGGETFLPFGFFAPDK